MKFIYIKAKEQINNLTNIVFEILNDNLTIDKFIDQNNTLIIFFNYYNVDIKNAFISLSSDLFTDLLVYESINYSSNKQLEEAIKQFEFVFEKNNLNYQYYNNKLLLNKLYHQTDNNLKKLVLNKYYNDLEMNKTIKSFLENNQNVTLASKDLYLHRNSLDQRLKKFEEVTSFDLKNFKDAFLIYHLI